MWMRPLIKPLHLHDTLRCGVKVDYCLGDIVSQGAKFFHIQSCLFLVTMIFMELLA